jgi:hypothetical protein
MYTLQAQVLSNMYICRQVSVRDNESRAPVPFESRWYVYEVSDRRSAIMADFSLWFSSVCDEKY